MESRIESRAEVVSFISRMKHALANGAKILFQVERGVETKRDARYTNAFTISDLFPDKNPTEALREELGKIEVDEYIETVKDVTYPGRSDMRVFGRRYNGKDDVYIKIRVELFASDGNHLVFVMSFHYAMHPIPAFMYPYGKTEEGK